MEFIKCSYGRNAYVILPSLAGVAVFTAIGVIDALVAAVMAVTVSMFLIVPNNSLTAIER